MLLALQVAQIVAPVFVLALIGIFWVRTGWNYDTEFVTRLAMTISVPCLIFMALVRSDVNPTLLRDTVLAAATAYILVGAAVWIVVRATGADTATYWAPLTFGNTGNLGLPLALFAFGQTGFDFAVVVFAVMAVLSFTIGVWVVSGSGSPVTALREPMLWATLLGAGFLVAGWPVPQWAARSIDLVGQMGIPLMLITLGVALSRLQPKSLSAAFWISLGKLVLCVTVSWGTGLWFGLPQEALAVLVLQVSTPVAVTSYMLAAKFGARASEVAGLVVVSTLLSVLSIPLLLAWLV